MFGLFEEGEQEGVTLLVCPLVCPLVGPSCMLSVSRKGVIEGEGVNGGRGRSCGHSGFLNEERDPS